MKNHGEPEEQLVQVFDTQQESEALVVQGLLQSSGIEAMHTALDATQDVLPGVGGTVIRVREEHAAEARRIIAAYRTDQRPASTQEGGRDENPGVSDPTAA